MQAHSGRASVKPSQITPSRVIGSTTARARVGQATAGDSAWAICFSSAWEIPIAARSAFGS